MNSILKNKWGKTNKKSTQSNVISHNIYFAYTTYSLVEIKKIYIWQTQNFLIKRKRSVMNF